MYNNTYMQYRHVHVYIHVVHMHVHVYTCSLHACACVYTCSLHACACVYTCSLHACACVHGPGIIMWLLTNCQLFCSNVRHPKEMAFLLCVSHGVPYSRVIRRPSLISAASLLGAALLLAPSYSLLGLQVHYSRLVIGK